MKQAMPRFIQTFEIFRVARVRQGVKVDHLAVGKFLKHKFEEGRTNKAGAAGDEQLSRFKMRDDYQSSSRPTKISAGPDINMALPAQWQPC
jgi:hypothetical protein